MKKVGFVFTLPQLDILFNKIDKDQKGFINLEKWNTLIYDECKHDYLYYIILELNPLQLVRQHLLKKGIQRDDLYHKIK
jgi:hypothetical protein